MTLDALVTALNATGFSFAAHAWNDVPDDYVWGTVSLGGEHGADWANDAQEDQAVILDIDVWAQADLGDVFDAVQGVLKASGMPWRFTDALYDSGHRALHFSWEARTLEVFGDGDKRY